MAANASPRASTTGKAATGTPSTIFDCNICLDAVSSPVVTLCGHLYCWPCLYQWMAQHTECPVCKAGISEDNVVPVYGRGADTADPRAQPLDTPERPRGQRIDPELLRRRRPRNLLAGGAFSSASPTLGIFPAFFSGSGPFGPLSSTHTAHGGANGPPLTPQEQQQRVQQAFLSRVLLIVGSLVLLCLLTF